MHKADPESILRTNADGEQIVAKKTQYKDTDTMFKAVGGVIMWAILDHIIRPYSHAGLVILRVCHEYRCCHLYRVKWIKQCCHLITQVVHVNG